MAIPTDLDTPLEFLNEDGTVESKTFEDLSNCWHQGQADDLASGVTADQVKKFFDYIPAKVILPWLQALTVKANLLGEKALQRAEVVDNCLRLTFADGSTYTSESLKGKPAGNLERFMLVLDGLDMSGSVVMQRIINELGLSEQTSFNIFVPGDQAIYRGSYEDVLKHEAGYKMEPLMTFGGGTGIPYTEVETLPEISEEAKGIVYKVGEKFYTIKSVTIGDGYLVPGKMYASGAAITNNTQSDMLSVAYSNIDTNAQLLFRFLDRSASVERSVYWCGGGNYPDEGYFDFGDGGTKYLYDFYDGGMPFESVYTGMYSWGENAVEVLEVTRLGAEFFGGVASGWTNFITGEEV